MIEEHVIKIAELQEERKAEETAADIVSAAIDEMIESAKQDLVDMEDTRRYLREPQEITIGELDAKIDKILAMIIDEWTGEHKTMVFDACTLKFTTRGSLKIHDDVFLFAELYDHIKLDVLIDKYLKGFNLTAVKKYMGVHELPIDVAEIEYKTTVKLE